MKQLIDFSHNFTVLTGNPPFPWQSNLFARFLEHNYPTACDIPTGLGKTSAISIWLLALAEHVRAGTLGGYPRRLAYVVNRRTVVDQATREAIKLRKALEEQRELIEIADCLKTLSVIKDGPIIAISTLRGQFADNMEWRNDPARPAIIVGTVDMIGSRLLFSGYGCGFKSKPLHAGFLGQDTLLLHDEAHLEPAFQKLLNEICREQMRSGDYRQFRVIALTATARDGQVEFGLTDEDHKSAFVSKRLNAKKAIVLHPIDDPQNVSETILNLALQHRESGKPILIFVKDIKSVEDIEKGLAKEKQVVRTLTGTMRGLERDKLAESDEVFARFKPDDKTSTNVSKTLEQLELFATQQTQTAAAEPGTVYLVCTSAGEVGVDISGEHLVCDLTPFDSMAQRFGRVNRYGHGNARIDVVHAIDTKELLSAKSSEDDSVTADDEQTDEDDDGGKPLKKKDRDKARYEAARLVTLKLLSQLTLREDGQLDGSPAALSQLPLSLRLAGFTPTPDIPAVSDILFDAWAMTTFRGTFPGRPPVADWLHGVAGWEPPETHVAWRTEVEKISDDLAAIYKPESLLEDYPLKPHELLRDNTERVSKHLAKLAENHPTSAVWIIDNEDNVVIQTLEEVANEVKDYLSYKTVLLPPSAGGLNAQGFLDGKAAYDRAQDYDVADLINDAQGCPRRMRVWDDESAREKSMRRVRTLDLLINSESVSDEEEESDRRRFWYWYVRPESADDDSSNSATHEQSLTDHLELAGKIARAFATKLGLADIEAAALLSAVTHHDLGKNRSVWQRSIGNALYPQSVLAKSGGAMRPIDLSGYRHEFGSLLDIIDKPEFQGLDEQTQQLTLHLIATHHGRARPHFPEEEAFDPERTEAAAAAKLIEVPRRFAQQQRRYGRWGLAYLESLVRAADILASQMNERAPAKIETDISTSERRLINESI